MMEKPSVLSLLFERPEVVARAFLKDQPSLSLRNFECVAASRSNCDASILRSIDRARRIQSFPCACAIVNVLALLAGVMVVQFLCLVGSVAKMNNEIRMCVCHFQRVDFRHRSDCVAILWLGLSIG